MVKFDVDDDGDFLDQQPDQGDCSFMSDDDDDYLDGQSDQGEDGFMSGDDDDSSLHEQSSSDQEDDCSSMSDDADSSLDEQSDQEDDDDDFFDQEPDRQANIFMKFLMGAIRRYTDRGFHSPAGAGGEDGPAGTFSQHYYVVNFTGRRVPRLRIRRFPAAEDYAVELDEDDPFPVQAPPVAASEAAVAALEAAEEPADDCCPVCLQDGAAPGAAWTRVAPCGHRFHAACVAQWLRVKLSCPVCRRPAAAAAAPTACRRDDVVEEPSRSLPIPDIVEEMFSIGYEESLVLECTSRWMEFMGTFRLPSTGNSSG
uniref:RING-type domain-containing protein n=1 Tax=Setaria italica TaxID=4555 RepID=K3Y383_SETIT